MAKKYPEPFKAFKFLVEVENPGGSVIVGAFSAFSGVRMKVEVMRGRTGNETRGTFANQPGLTSFENVTLTQGVVGDNDFLDWILSTAASDTTAPTGKNMRRTITVVALTDQNKRGVEWKLINCLPVGYSTGQFNSTQSSVLTETIEFAIEGFKRTVNDPESSTTSGGSTNS